MKQPVMKMMMMMMMVKVVTGTPTPNPADCDGVNAVLHKDQLHKVLGDWVLVWSASDHENAWEVFPNLNSSHVQLRLLDQNTTLEFKERNLLRDNWCITYTLNLTTSDPQHSMSVQSGIVDKNGHVESYNESGVLDVYQSCSDCLQMLFTEAKGRFLLFYRREGLHTDAEQLKSDQGEFVRKSECLSINVERHFSYDGRAGFCHKRSVELKNEPTQQPDE